jgi:hypothetical protein
VGWCATRVARGGPDGSRVEGRNRNEGLGLGKRSWSACGKMEVVEGSYSRAAEGKTECKIV